jgi:hypothetical protein
MKVMRNRVRPRDINGGRLPPRTPERDLHP